MVRLQEKTLKLLREGIPKVKEAIRRIIRKLDTGEGWEQEEEHIAYMTVDELCSVDTNGDSIYVIKCLYGLYKKALDRRIREKAIPSLKNKEGMVFLRELLRQWSYYFELSHSLALLFRVMETKGRLYITPLSLKQISVLRFCIPIWGRFFPIIDQALLDKVGSGALIEGRPNDRDAKLIEKMLRFFAHMYRVYSKPVKYINNVMRKLLRNQQQARGGSW